MTGHDDRCILSGTTDTMTSWTGSPDIMSVRSDLLKHLHTIDADMMTGFARPMIVDHADLRKHAVRPDLAAVADIMSTHLSTITARSGRRNP